MSTRKRSPYHFLKVFSLFGLTHADLAARLGVSPALVSSWSVGRRGIPLQKYRQLIAYASELNRAAMDRPRPDARNPERVEDLLHLLRTEVTVYEAELARVRPYYGTLEKAGQDLARYASRPPETWTLEDLQTVRAAQTTHRRALTVILAGGDLMPHMALGTLRDLIQALEHMEGPAADTSQKETDHAQADAGGESSGEPDAESPHL